MSMHKSLKYNKFKHKKRTVRKRYERFRSLKLQNKWDKEHSIFRLPKEKRIFKRKKSEEQKQKELEKQESQTKRSLSI